MKNGVGEEMEIRKTSVALRLFDNRHAGRWSMIRMEQVRQLGTMDDTGTQ